MSNMEPLALRIAARFRNRMAFGNLTAFGVKDLDQLSKMGRQFAVISAYRPPEEAGKHQNKDKHGELMADLQRMGYKKFETLKSSWEDMAGGGRHGEKSILVPNMNFEDATKLMKKYNQDGILYKDHSGSVGIYTKDGTAEMAYDTKSGDAAISKAIDKSEYSKGRGLSFGLQLVPGKFKWSGGPITGEDIKKHVESQAKEDTGSGKEEDKGGESDWWKGQTPAFKKDYCQEHENSAYCK